MSAPAFFSGWGWLRACAERARGWLDWLYPVRCLKCGCSLLGEHSPGLCPECEKEIRYLGAEVCRHCGSLLGDGAHATGQAVPQVLLAWSDGAPTGDSAAEGEDPAGRARCAHCAGGEGDRYTRAAGVVRYVPPARDLVHDFKYRGNRGLARILAPQMARRLREAGFPETYDYIIPVPLHRKRLRMRGYNQSLLLAQGVAQEIGGALCPRLLKRVRFTQAQALTAPAERAQNIAGAFRAAEKRLAGKTVLLVDDVMTTGATVNECARELRQAGATRIYVLVWAR